MNFPTTFADRLQLVEPGIGERGDAALTKLRDKGFNVYTGLTEEYAHALGIMAKEEHITEYCPKDPTEARFASLESIERWLQKGCGRAMFLLATQDMELAGYCWTGYEPCDKLPNHPITSAYRLGSIAVGQGLAKPFAQITVSGTNAFFAPNMGIGLETWQSNHAAKMYTDIGFEPQSNPDAQPELRPSQKPEAVDGKVWDTRLFMGYPTELLA